MASPGSDPSFDAESWPASARDPSFGAGVLSVALHVVVLLATALIPWSIPESRDAETVTLVWVAEPRLARNARAPVSETEIARALEMLEPDVARLPEPAPDRGEPAPPPEPEPEPEQVVEPGEPAASDAPEPEPVEVEPPRAPATEPTTPQPTSEPLRRDVDWEAERQRAAREVVDALARERDYPTFSLDDLDEDPPPEEPGQDVDVFDSEGGSSGPRLLDPGQSRTRFGRRLADLCNTLTGGGMGVSLQGIGLFSLCGTSNARSDLFASIKPDYLKARPECTEVVQPAGLTGEAVKKTHDCRLVLPEQEE